jgi:hypothetical protein
MSTTAPRRETDRPSVEREAWERYADSLRDLRGREYEDAERESWQQLQDRLREITRPRPA